MVVAICYIGGEINPANDSYSRYIHLLNSAYVIFPINVTYRDYHRQFFTTDRIMHVKNQGETFSRDLNLLEKAFTPFASKILYL